MADDLRDTFGDDAFMDAEEEVTEEEGGEKKNRTFLIGVGLLGGLLLLAIAAFVVWAMVLNPRQAAQRAEENAQIMATNEAVLIAMQQTQTVEALPPATATATSVPKTEPTPTPTPVIRATNTPAPEGENGDAGDTVGETAPGTPGAGTPVAATATVRARMTATPVSATTAEAKSISTPATTTPSATPDTGLGEVLLIVAAGLLATLVIFARKLRQA